MKLSSKWLLSAMLLLTIVTWASLNRSRAADETKEGEGLRAKTLGWAQVVKEPGSNNAYTHNFGGIVKRVTTSGNQIDVHLKHELDPKRYAVSITPAGEGVGGVDKIGIVRIGQLEEDKFAFYIYKFIETDDGLELVNAESGHVNVAIIGHGS